MANAAGSLTSVRSIVVRPEQLDLKSADGALISELSYDSDPPHFVDTLSAVLGAPAEVDPDAGGCGVRWAGVRVAWGPGATGPKHGMKNMVDFDRAIVGDGVSVVTVQGFKPGDDVSAFAAQRGRTYWTTDSGAGQNLIDAEVGAELGPSPVAGYLNAHAVAVSDDPAAPGASDIFAPFNFGVEDGSEADQS